MYPLIFKLFYSQSKIISYINTKLIKKSKIKVSKDHPSRVIFRSVVVNLI